MSGVRKVTPREIGTHIIQSDLSLWVWGPRSESNPSYICPFPNLINHHPQSLHYHWQLVDKTMVLSTVGWFVNILVNNRYQLSTRFDSSSDNELIVTVDNVVLINKHPLSPEFDTVNYEIRRCPSLSEDEWQRFVSVKDGLLNEFEFFHLHLFVFKQTVCHLTSKTNVQCHGGHGPG